MTARLHRRSRSTYVFCLLTAAGDPLPASYHKRAWRKSVYPLAKRAAHWGVE